MRDTLDNRNEQSRLLYSVGIVDGSWGYASLYAFVHISLSLGSKEFMGIGVSMSRTVVD